MSRMYFAKNGTYLDTNIGIEVVLDKIAIGLPGTSKIGLPGTLSESSAKEYARRIRTTVESVKCGELIPDPIVPEKLKKAYEDLFIGSMVTGGIIGGDRLDVIEDEEEKRLLLVIADFFDQSGGTSDAFERRNGRDYLQDHFQ